jgi:hypothetical protein
MAMRGDDIIAIKIEKKGSKPEFLKGEVKSRTAISGPAVAAAREALRKNNSRPSPHALSFIADRLHAEGETELANAIDDAQLKDGIALNQVAHLIFSQRAIRLTISSHGFGGTAPAGRCGTIGGRRGCVSAK